MHLVYVIVFLCGDGSSVGHPTQPLIDSLNALYMRLYVCGYDMQMSVPISRYSPSFIEHFTVGIFRIAVTFRRRARDASHASCIGPKESDVLGNFTFCMCVRSNCIVDYVRVQMF